MKARPAPPFLFRLQGFSSFFCNVFAAQCCHANSIHGWRRWSRSMKRPRAHGERLGRVRRREELIRWRWDGTAAAERSSRWRSAAMRRAARPARAGCFSRQAGRHCWARSRSGQPRAARASARVQWANALGGALWGTRAWWVFHILRHLGSSAPSGAICVICALRAATDERGRRVSDRARSRGPLSSKDGSGAALL